MNKRAKINIAIDGPSGSGKGTTSKNLAKKLGYNYLDTGSMYRAIAFYFNQNNIDITNLQNFDTILNSIKLDFNSQNHIMLNKIDIENLIRTPKIGQLASDISKISAIREFLTKKQKKIVENGGYIAEGRDIGSIIMPNSELKIYLTATIDARAKRRLLDFQKKGIEITLEEVKKQIIIRDKQDMERKLAPLVKLPDAIEVDTSNITIDEQVDIIYKKAIKIIEKLERNFEILNNFA